MSFHALVWWIFAALAFGGGVGMVAGKKPVASLMSLVLSLFSLGVLYIMAGAHFIGAVQVIVYAGAIMVMFLFVIMLLNLGHDYASDLRTVGWIAAGSVAAGVLAWLVMRTFTHETTLVVTGGGMSAAEAVEEFGAVGAVALPLFREYVVGFELTSLLLLAAIIGAIVLAKRRI